MNDPASFYAEAQYQRVCAVCGSPGTFEAHHVVAKQRLKRMGRLDVLHDPRNALRLCPGCHGGHTCGAKPIPTERLTPDNIRFMCEVLGTAGQNYLERHYTGVDRRYTACAEGAWG